jgi:hypothetical protein
MRWRRRLHGTGRRRAARVLPTLFTNDLTSHPQQDRHDHDQDDQVTCGQENRFALEHSDSLPVLFECRTVSGVLQVLDVRLRHRLLRFLGGPDGIVAVGEILERRDLAVPESVETEYTS